MALPRSASTAGLFDPSTSIEPSERRHEAIDPIAERVPEASAALDALPPRLLAEIAPELRALAAGLADEERAGFAELVLRFAERRFGWCEAPDLDGIEWPAVFAFLAAPKRVLELILAARRGESVRVAALYAGDGPRVVPSLVELRRPFEAIENGGLAYERGLARLIQALRPEKAPKNALWTAWEREAVALSKLLGERLVPRAIGLESGADLAALLQSRKRLPIFFTDLAIRRRDRRAEFLPAIVYDFDALTFTVRVQGMRSSGGKLVRLAEQRVSLFDLGLEPGDGPIAALLPVLTSS